MGISESDNQQDKTLSEHGVRIARLEMDMNMVLQTTSETAKSVAVLSETAKNLAAASASQLTAITEHATKITETESNVRWVRNIGYAVLGVALGLVGWYLKMELGG